ncbi:hypothetical protein [Methylotuvimicrobium sp. KM2]|uniref:hypothetical protein n=1 Tax=Methylotuvimicrobium sp. KM2 TaxID=3133976 RepID=UPI0031012782
MKFSKLLPFGKPSQLLVCETDGFSLRGAVLVRSGTQVVVLHQAKIEQVDMADAVADLIAALKNDGWHGGGSAVLLSPAVLSTLVELPVNPKKPRPLQQMMELVRWEVEPLLMQHMTRWSVGHLLVGQGYMTEEQAQAVMDLQQGKPNKAGGLALSDKFSLRRFGDLAEELGYIKRSQLNACLTGQEWLKSDDETIECGWAAQGPVEDIPGTFSWLVSCVNKSLLQRWIDVFARQGVKLKSLYPLTGCSTTLLPKNPSSELILESHRGMTYGMRLHAGRIAEQRQYLNVTKTPLEICLENYHALHGAPNEPVWLACWHDDAHALAQEMRQMLEIEVEIITDPAIGTACSPGMVGAARHAFGFAGDERCVGVRNGGPLPPLPQRIEVRGAALAVVLLLSIGASEVSLMVRKSSVETHKQDVDSRWKVVDEATKRINAQIQEIEKRKQALAQKKADLAHLEAMLDFYSNAAPQRTALVQGVLGVLQTAVTDEVIIVAIDETSKRGNTVPAPISPSEAQDKRVEVESFHLDAWAISEAAAQTFIQKMKEAIAPWQLEIRDAHVTSRAGPLNLDGFGVSMRLVKLVQTDRISQLQQKAVRS